MTSMSSTEKRPAKKQYHLHLPRDLYEEVIQYQTKHNKGLPQCWGTQLQ